MQPKTRLKFVLLLITAASIFSHSLFGETKDGFRLGHITTADGLPSSSVSSVIQDKNKYLWFGTQGGLARYNGYDFRIFNNAPFDSNSLSHNLIQTMTSDPDGRIWIGTYDGLNLFDPVTERFTRYSHVPGDPSTLSNNIVVSIFIDSRGRLWAGTLNGLNLMRPDGSFRRFFHDPDDESSLPDKVVRTIIEDSDGNVFAGTHGGLARYVEDTGSFEKLVLRTEDGEPAEYAVMAAVYGSRKDEIWLGLWDGGLVRLDTSTMTTEQTALPGINIYKLCLGSEGRLWIGSWGQGIHLYDPATGKTETHTASDTETLSNNVIYSLFEDESGIMWIGTNGGGLHKYVRQHNRFQYLSTDGTGSSGLSEGKVHALFEDSRRYKWVSVYGKGLNRINPDGSISVYEHEAGDDSSLPNNIVNFITEDSGGRIWLGTNGGYALYRPETDDFERHYNPFAPDQPSENIFDRILEDSQGRIWLGTYNSGLLVYSRDDETFLQFQHDPNIETSLSNDLIRDITEDRRGRIWVATNRGLNLYAPERNEFRRFMHGDQGTLSANDTRTIAEDREGNLWIGTAGGGISIYSPEDDAFSYLSRDNGLISNIIYNISTAREGEIWITNQNGISVYSPALLSVRHIDRSSGLLDGEPTSGLLFASDGLVYCGSSTGITGIPLNWKEQKSYYPEVRITRVEVNGTPILNENNPIKNASLNLKHNQNNINIELNCTDYSLPRHNSFIYRLEGFDEDWIQAGHRQFLSYTNLSPGTYTFIARAAGSSNNWSSNLLNLRIRINPNPLISPAAASLYIIAAFSTFILLIRRQRRRQRQIIDAAAETERNNRELEHRVRVRTAEIDEARKTAEEALNAKSLFLANMSHEIRTPLNGILGMLSLLRKTEPNREQEKYIEYSHISAENLLLLLDDLLDYERLMSGKVKLAEEDFRPAEIVEYVTDLFSQQAENKNIMIRSAAASGIPEVLRGDRRKLTQILCNIVSNAVKYTDSGEIDIRCGGRRREETFEYTVRVSDSGRGIPEDKLRTIFNSFEQLDSSYTKTEKGVGLGLAIVDELVRFMNGSIKIDSTPGEGSTFSIELPFKITGTARPARPEPVTPAADRSADIKVLAAEDEAINRLYIRKILADNGYRQVLCNNGLEAVEKYRTESPDIIFMDIGMPVLNGLEAVSKIREIEKNEGGKTPIVMLSAHVYKDDIERAKTAGADDFLPKPFNERDFLRMLNRQLAAQLQKTD